VLRLRVLTAAVGLPLVLASILIGPVAFAVFIAVVAGVCAYELCRLAPGVAGRDPLITMAVAWAVVLSLKGVLRLPEGMAAFVLAAPLFLSLLLLLPSSASRRSFGQWSWAIAGALYVGVFLGHWGALYQLPLGAELVVFGMLVTFAYDSFAFFSGRSFGRHKLAPHLSAGKTWEGVAGGMAMAVVVGLLVRIFIMSTSGSFPWSVGAVALVAVAISVAAQVGDLIESGVKRSAGVKDMGAVLPGHGGMLDRFDSLLLTGPVLYYVALWGMA
jgi:phosphatidate cytidylyltransferase